MSKNARQVLNELLVDIFNQILILEERYHRVHGVKLSMTEVHTLEAIDDSNSKMMSDVATRLRITQGTLTTTINRLSHKGYVVRKKDEIDKRITRLELTEKGQEVMEIHQQFHDEMVDRLLLYIDEDSDLIHSVEQINSFFKELHHV